MIFAALKLAHVLAVVVWIGGMVFAHFFLRPAALKLEPPQRKWLLPSAAAGVPTSTSSSHDSSYRRTTGARVSAQP